MFLDLHCGLYTNCHPRLAGKSVSQPSPSALSNLVSRNNFASPHLFIGLREIVDHLEASQIELGFLRKFKTIGIGIAALIGSTRPPDVQGNVPTGQVCEILDIGHSRMSQRIPEGSIRDGNGFFKIGGRTIAG